MFVIEMAVTWHVHSMVPASTWPKAALLWLQHEQASPCLGNSLVRNKFKAQQPPHVHG